MNDLRLLIWIGTNLISTALVLSVAVMMVRHRRHYSGLILAGAIPFAVASVFSTIHLAGTLLGLHRLLARWSDWLEYSGFAYSWGLILFLLGIFFQCLRQKGEVARLAELEAILQDQQRPVPPHDRR